MNLTPLLLKDPVRSKRQLVLFCEQARLTALVESRALLRGAIARSCAVAGTSAGVSMERAARTPALFVYHSVYIPSAMLYGVPVELAGLDMHTRRAAGSVRGALVMFARGA